MRRLLILSALLLSACQSEPSFEERYEVAREQIEDKAKELDSELQQGPGAENTDAGEASTPEAG